MLVISKVEVCWFNLWVGVKLGRPMLSLTLINEQIFSDLKYDRPNKLTDWQLSNEMERLRLLIIFLEMYIEDIDLRRFMKIRQAGMIGNEEAHGTRGLHLMAVKVTSQTRRKRVISVLIWDKFYGGCSWGLAAGTLCVLPLHDVRFGKGEIGQLFLAGFGSSMLFGTIWSKKIFGYIVHNLHFELHHEAFT
ncbi:putative molybdate-anion transporter [Helianthus anomalus]